MCLPSCLLFFGDTHSSLAVASRLWLFHFSVNKTLFVPSKVKQRNTQTFLCDSIVCNLHAQCSVTYLFFFLKCCCPHLCETIRGPHTNCASVSAPYLLFCVHYTIFLVHRCNHYFKFWSITPAYDSSLTQALREQSNHLPDVHIRTWSKQLASYMAFDILKETASMPIYLKKNWLIYLFVGFEFRSMIWRLNILSLYLFLAILFFLHHHSAQSYSPNRSWH